METDKTITRPNDAYLRMAARITEESQKMKHVLWDEDLKGAESKKRKAG
jgi:hypothetical protein